jgi:hypothetical protein
MLFFKQPVTTYAITHLKIKHITKEPIKTIDYQYTCSTWHKIARVPIRWMRKLFFVKMSSNLNTSVTLWSTFMYSGCIHYSMPRSVGHGVMTLSWVELSLIFYVYWKKRRGPLQWTQTLPPSWSISRQSDLFFLVCRTFARSANYGPCHSGSVNQWKIIGLIHIHAKTRTLVVCSIICQVFTFWCTTKLHYLTHLENDTKYPPCGLYCCSMIQVNSSLKLLYSVKLNFLCRWSFLFTQNWLDFCMNLVWNTIVWCAVCHIKLLLIYYL